MSQAHTEIIESRIEKHIVPLFTKGKRRGDITTEDLQKTLDLGKTRTGAIIRETTKQENVADATAYLRDTLTIQQYIDLNELLEERGLRKSPQPYRPMFTEEAQAKRKEKAKQKKEEAIALTQQIAQEDPLMQDGATDVQTAHVEVPVVSPEEIAEKYGNQYSDSQRRQNAMERKQKEDNLARRLESQLTPEYEFERFLNKSTREETLVELEKSRVIALAENENVSDGHEYILAYSGLLGFSTAKKLTESLELSSLNSLIKPNDGFKSVIRFRLDNTAEKI